MPQVLISSTFVPEASKISLPDSQMTEQELPLLS